ncbi:MAG TPA: ester cyclase [Thermoanaerobaculia bacterium]|nr:ester cyclase [Thermoanaerobaculia bacterium]
MKTLRTVLFLFLGLLALPLAVQSQDMSANKALVRRYLGEVLSAGRLDQLDQLLASDFVDSTPGAPKDVRGPEVIRAAQQRAREIFPEVEYKVEDLVAEGDKVVARYTVRATSRGSESSPGRPVEVTGVTIFRIADRKIREAWIVNDQIEMFLQLGYTLQPPQ